MRHAGRREAERNALVHDRIADGYDAKHSEIFNDIEQARLRGALTAAVSSIATGTSGQLRALDFGSGTGNVTRHLLGLGLHVTAADPSSRSLEVLSKRYGNLGQLYTKALSDAELEAEQPEQFDFVASYSVLHHVPDYLMCIEELLRVLRPGGVLYIDHEASPQYWAPTLALIELRAITAKRVGKLQKLCDPQRVLDLNWWYQFVRRALNPRYMPEGDIHVWPDDHIEWDKISELLRASAAKCLLLEDYLAFRGDYSPSVYEEYRGKCADMRLIVAKKALASRNGATTPTRE